ncbi:MAG: FAD-dependent oxidoreductase [Bacteroidales bacterium]|nr:FAD-dependent oxidoreductase [Bacteroidales bacterium]
MSKINSHPILSVPSGEKHTFLYNGVKVEGEKGFTIAAALHNAGFPVHSHSQKNRNRSLECGIGKCGACEMLVDGVIRRICITLVDDVKEVNTIPKNFMPSKKDITNQSHIIHKTDVAIIGAGPAGLAAREVLNKHNVSNIVIDNNSKIGGQFNMQTHQFFFFEKEKKYGGMRGFDIASTLAGGDTEGIFLNSTVWDILEDKLIAVKNIKTGEIFFVEADHLIVATGAVPFMPTFENDDIPGVYTAAVVQKMMNTEFTLLGKRVLTVGAGNIGYLTSYQLMQAGAQVVAIIEAMDREGGFPVQANRVRRLGIPIMLNHVLISAIPNDDYTGVKGAIIAEAKNFKPIPGTEKIIENIDAINICTGLVPDDQLITLGNTIFGRNCHGVGDSVRIGEGTSAVLRGQQAAYEVLEMLAVRYNYNDYLAVSKEYIDSQQHPTKVINEPFVPDKERRQKPFVQIDCLYGFACNPCSFACPHGAISKSSTSTVPVVDYNKCIGCMKCVYQCPGLAIFGYNIPKDLLFLPIEYAAKKDEDVFLVDNNGQILGEGVIDNIMENPNKTNVARIKSTTIHGDDLLKVRGFIVKKNYPKPLDIKKTEYKQTDKTYICHCDDVTLEEVLDRIGDRKFISIDEIKHTTRLGMGACRGKRCIKRLKSTVISRGINVVGDATPRGPLSNQVLVGELYPTQHKDRVIPFTKNEKIERRKVKSIVAGGGIAGSSLFRYLSEAGFNPVLINHDRGSSWRNIAGGRPAFSLPELSDIAIHNRDIFKELQKIKNIDFKPTRYISFAHDEATYKSLDESRAWSDAYMVDKKDFIKEISPYFNPSIDKYSAALISNDCWQATPGLVIDLIRTLGIEKGGEVLEDCQLIDLHKDGSKYIALIRDHNKKYIELESEIFINALGYNADKFANKLNIETKLFAVRHQAFITRKLPMLGKDGDSLDMLIDRRKYKGFSSVYGQQLKETGQIIGCASPLIDHNETDKNLVINTKEFLDIVSEVFCDWIPQISSVGFQALWSGYYTEPRYIIDTELGLFVGMRGHGFMLSQFLAKLYVDKLCGKNVPDYFEKLSLKNEGLSEEAFK